MLHDTKQNESNSLIMLDINQKSLPVSITLYQPDEQINEIITTKEETVLSAMERQGIEVQSHCREGVCGMCRQELLIGDVEYIKTPLAWIGDGEILPCVCRATNSIAIDLDRG